MQINSIEILGRDGCSTCSSMYQTVIDIMAEKKSCGGHSACNGFTENHDAWRDESSGRCD